MIMQNHTEGNGGSSSEGIEGSIASMVTSIISIARNKGEASGMKKEGMYRKITKVG